MTRSRKSQPGVTPISNLPETTPRDATSPDFPTATDFKVYALQRDIVMLRQDRMALLTKLTRCLEVLQSELRFFEVGMVYNEWETYDQLRQRIARLKGAIALIQDSTAGISDETARKAREG